MPPLVHGSTSHSHVPHTFLYCRWTTMDSTWLFSKYLFLTLHHTQLHEANGNWAWSSPGMPSTSLGTWMTCHIDTLGTLGNWLTSTSGCATGGLGMMLYGHGNTSWCWAQVLMILILNLGRPMKPVILMWIWCGAMCHQDLNGTDVDLVIGLITPMLWHLC